MDGLCWGHFLGVDDSTREAQMDVDAEQRLQCRTVEMRLLFQRAFQKASFRITLRHGTWLTSDLTRRRSSFS
jgi:hypothetical protein